MGSDASCFYSFVFARKESESGEYFMTDGDQLPSEMDTELELSSGLSIWVFLSFLKIDESALHQIRKLLDDPSLLERNYFTTSQGYVLNLRKIGRNTLYLDLRRDEVTEEPLEMDKLYELIINHDQEAITLLRLHRDGFRFLYMNQVYEVLTGLKYSQVSGKTLKEVLGDDTYQKCEKLCFEAIEMHRTRVIRESRTWTGIEVECFTRISPVWYGGCQYVLVEELEIDIMKGWMKQNQLSLTKFDAMFQAHSSMMVLIEPDSGRFVDANPACIHFYGYSLEEIRSMTVQQINMLDPKLIAEYRRQAKHGSMHNFLFPHRLKSGEIKYVDVYSSPIEIDGVTYLYSIINDATERNQIQEELQRQTDLLKITMKSIGDGFVTTDLQGKILQMNPYAEKVTGRSLEKAQGVQFSEVFDIRDEQSGKTADLFQSFGEEKAGDEKKGQGILFSAQFEQMFIEYTITAIKDELEKVFGAVLIFRDITLERAKKNETEYLSYHDPLTGLYNRRYYYDYISEMDIEQNYPIGVIMGDVNGLKLTNDAFGHELGDELLVTVANIIRFYLDKKGIAVRWGGDEFVILIPGADLEKLELCIGALRKKMSYVRIDSRIQVSVSFGMALKTDRAVLIDEVLKEAEELMYQEKRRESILLRKKIIDTLMSNLDKGQTETREHINRIERMSLQIADQIGLGEQEKGRLMLLARYHDIGESVVPQSLLHKKEKLTKDEWELIRHHADSGYRIASNIPEFYSMAAEIRHHHEWWDGSGYPDGLAGEQIPVNCRILAVVDAYDVMTHSSPYKEAVSHEEAVRELLRMSGIQFDRNIVDSFVLLNDTEARTSDLNEGEVLC